MEHVITMYKIRNAVSGNQFDCLFYFKEIMPVIWKLSRNIYCIRSYSCSRCTAQDGAWCVCRQDASDSTLQKTIDYACGAGADCGPINQNGACYNPSSVKSHCSYAVNSYYQRKGQTPQACDFAGIASLTQQDPSSNGCTFPASSSASGISTGNNNAVGIGAGNGTTPVTGSGAGTSMGTGAGTTTGVFPTPSGTNPGSTTPRTMTPTSSGTGGVMGGLSPSGNVISTDNSSHGLILMAELTSFLVLIFSVLVICLGFDLFV